VGAVPGQEEGAGRARGGRWRQGGDTVKPRIVKLRSGFLATTVPGSETLDRDGNMFLPAAAHGNCGDWSCPTCNPRIRWYGEPPCGPELAGLTVEKLEFLGRLYAPHEHELTAQQWVGLEGLTQDELREISGLNQVTK